jgi:hypothetical protein
VFSTCSVRSVSARYKLPTGSGRKVPLSLSRRMPPQIRGIEMISNSVRPLNTTSTGITLYATDIQQLTPAVPDDLARQVARHQLPEPAQ